MEKSIIDTTDKSIREADIVDGKGEDESDDDFCIVSYTTNADNNDPGRFNLLVLWGPHEILKHKSTLLYDYLIGKLRYKCKGI